MIGEMFIVKADTDSMQEKIEICRSEELTHVLMICLIFNILGLEFLGKAVSIKVL